MKLFFTLLLTCNLGFSQTYPSSCIATPTIERLYKNDAYKCASSRILNINSTYRDTIDLPAIYRDSAARVFYAIHNMAPSLLKDTILNLFGFSIFSNLYQYETDSLHFTNLFSPLDATSVKSVEMYNLSAPIPWANDWLSGNYNNTAYQQVNELVNKYQLSISGTSTFGIIYFRVMAAAGLNTRGLAYKFNQIIGSPTACYPTNYIGDGNSISLNYENDGIKISYRNGCGDCPSGCTWARIWTFKVYFANCNVEYLGAVNYGFPLPPGSIVYTCTRGPVFPVNFGSITGYLQNGKAALNWKILTQVNVKEYVIERSDNGQQFYTAGTVASTNALIADYTWKDAALLTGMAWYRIKAIDLDGKFKYSSIIKITGASKANSFTVYPNPVVNKSFTIQFGLPVAGQMQAGLYSIAGKKVWAATLSLAPQTVSRTIALPAAIPPGVYALVVENNGTSYQKIIVVKGE